MDSFTHTFQDFTKSLSNLLNDVWEYCFRKPKLLLAENRLIYLNISMGISKIYGPRPLARHSFLLRITISGVTTSGYLFYEVENAANLYCESNYNL